MVWRTLLYGIMNLYGDEFSVVIRVWATRLRKGDDNGYPDLSDTCNMKAYYLRPSLSGLGFVSSLYPELMLIDPVVLASY